MEVRLIKKLIGALAILAVLATPAVSGATATPTATITKVDARTFIFDASASPCKWSYCDFTWRYYGKNMNRLGATLGYGPTFTYVFPSYVTPGFYQSVVTESERCTPAAPRSCPGTFQVDFTVG